MRFEVVSEQRHRKEMQDTHSVIENFPEKEDLFGGVYDGHGNIRPSQIAAEIIPGLFKEKLVLHSPSLAFRMTYRLASQKVSGAPVGGTCAGNFFIRQGVIYYAHAGDILIMVTGKSARCLSQDHRVTNDKECQRILMAGGHVGTNYVQHSDGGGLMPTRTLGDHKYKKIGVTYLPSTGTYKIRDTDKFLILATDGLTDKVSLPEISSLALVAKNSKELALALKREVENRYGHDNLTILVVGLYEKSSANETT